MPLVSLRARRLRFCWSRCAVAVAVAVASHRVATRRVIPLRGGSVNGARRGGELPFALARARAVQETFRAATFFRLYPRIDRDGRSFLATCDCKSISIDRIDCVIKMRQLYQCNTAGRILLIPTNGVKFNILISIIRAFDLCRIRKS